MYTSKTGFDPDHFKIGILQENILLISWILGDNKRHLNSLNTVRIHENLSKTTITDIQSNEPVNTNESLH